MVRLGCALVLLAIVAAPAAARAGRCEGITVVVDNDDPGSGYSEERPENFQEHNVDACADTYRYLSRYVGDESTDGKAIWQPTITVAGTYRVVTGFRASENRTDDADYVLYGDDDATLAMVVDQRGDACQMVELGDVWCTPGGACRLELDGTDDMKSDAADVTTFELVDCDPPEPPEPSPCDGLAEAGFEVCGSSPGICEGVYTGGEGCIALCAAVGMTCIERYGGEPGCMVEPGDIPCDEVNDHASNYCVCQGEPMPETTSSGGDDGGSDGADDGDTGPVGTTDDGGDTSGATTTTGAPPALDSTAALPPGDGDGAQAGCGCTSARSSGGAWWLVAGLALARRRRGRRVVQAIVASLVGVSGLAGACGGSVQEFAESSTSSTSTDATSPTSTPTTTPTTTVDPSATTTGEPGTSSDADTDPPTTGTSTDTGTTAPDTSESSSAEATDGDSSSSTTGPSTRGQACVTGDDCEADAPHCVFNVCRDGSEGDPCILGTDCADANACMFGTCYDGSEGDPCILDADCGVVPVCVNASCWDGSDGDPCVDNDDCDAAPFCAQFLCNDGSVGDPCEDDADCDDAPYCVFSSCREGVEGDGCVDDGDCSDDAPFCVGAVCRDGSVGDPCVLPDDCMDDCVSSFCT